MNDYNIKELYEEMEMHLIKSMQRNLSRHLKEEAEVGFEYPQWQAIKLKELKRYQRENKDIIKKYTFGLNKDVSEHLKKELRQGSLQAINEYNKTHKNKLSPDKLMTKSFFKTNDRKVNNLIKVVNNDLNIANTSALRMMNDQYRQIIHKSAFFVGNGVMTEKQATDMAITEISEKKATMQAVDEASKNFLSGGLNCIEYSDGRRVNIASYAEMAVRTASLRTHLMGEGDFRKSIGRTLVQVTTHGESCDGCAGWEGKILVDDVYSGGKPDGKHTLLSEAMAQGLFHPNCRHGLTTYYEELEGISYDKPETDIQEELQDKINYYTRQEKRFDRLYNGSVDEDNINNYKNKKNRIKEMMTNLKNTIKDLKTNEKGTIVIDDFPEKHRNAINNIIDNSPKAIKPFLEQFKSQFRFKNTQTVKVARFNGKNIKVNLKKDAMKGYKTTFHEISHNLDKLMNRPSEDGVFKQLLIDDFNRTKKAFMLKYKLSEEETYKEISKILKSNRKLNPISDIIGGITDNKCVGNAKHEISYWKGANKLEREAFAQFGSSFIRKDKEEIEYITEMFPNASKHFKSYFRR